METTVGVARYAPLNAIALLVGSQTGRPGVMTQCAVEERRNLQLAISGLVTYAETLSVYGTEPVFVDGDDTPWSKSFLGAAYASRGVKVRFTSGTGSEALMGHAEGMSMLYLEARCISVVRAAGSQGVQNGSISCVALVLAVPGGTRAILAENVIAAWLDLEVASGNDAIASHSAIRKTAKLMGQFLPGTDFVTSGYSRHAAARQHLRRRQLRRRRHRRVADDPARLAGRRRHRAGRARTRCCASASAAALAVQAVFDELGLPAVTDAEVEAATSGYDAATCPTATAPPMSRRPTPRSSAACRVSTSHSRSTGAASSDVAEAIFDMQRQRVSADYLQTSAVIDADGLVHSAVNDPNVYVGPGTGYRLEGARWELLQALPHVIDAARARERRRPDAAESSSTRVPRRPRHRRRRGRGCRRARLRRRHPRDDQRARPRRRACGGADGLAEAGATPRLVRVRRTADVAFIAHDGARLSGSGIALGIQSKGTAVIHRADLQPLDNLELFGMSPLTRSRAIARWAATPPATRSAGASGRADRARQLRSREADRPHDAAARPRDAAPSPAAPGRRADARARPPPAATAVGRLPRQASSGSAKQCARGCRRHAAAARPLRAGPARGAAPAATRSRSSSSRKRRTSSQTTAAKNTSACSVVMRMPPRF